MTRALAALVLFAALPSQALTDHSGPYELQVIVGGTPAVTFRQDGETFVLGRVGERYTLRVVNRSARRVEAVVTVDGRDVIDGKPGDWRGKRGYLVPAWGTVEIDGWRISQREAAAFRFSTVAGSYAARTGNAREVGVIGVAVFPERWYPPARPPIYPQSQAPWNGGLREGSGAPQRENAAPRAEEGIAGAGGCGGAAGKVRRASRPGDGVRRGCLLASHRGSLRARAPAARHRDRSALRRSRRARRARHRRGRP